MTGEQIDETRRRITLNKVGGPGSAAGGGTSTESCPRHPRSDVPGVEEPAATKVSLYKEILYTEAEVDARITAMAVDITRGYKGRDTLFVALLNGALPFTAKLMRAIQHHDPHFHPNVQSMIVSRYGSSTRGVPRTW